MRIANHIPNTITSLNLLSGCVAVILSFNGDFKSALLFIIIAACFDFCDGFAARLLKAYSPLGKELDSLADMISFGLAPACIMFNKLVGLYGISTDILLSMDIAEALKYLLPLLCALLIAVFSALRLAKFNIDTRQSENFIGLATPSCALITGSLIYAAETYPSIDSFFAEYTYILPIAAVALSLLLVCEIPMFSFKFKTFGWANNRLKYIFLLCAAAFAIAEAAICGHFPLSIWIFTTFVFYILLNIAIYICTKKNIKA